MVQPLPCGARAPSPTCVGTASGRFVDLFAPDWRDIDMADVAFGLAGLPRWLRQSRRVLSIGEHCLLVGKLAPPRLRLAGDLHDAHEALCGDVVAPMERALVAFAGPKAGWALAEIKYGLDVAVARAALEAFAPAGVAGGERFVDAARSIALEMRAGQIVAADALAATYEDAVRRRDALQNLDAFGETAARHVGAWPPDEGEIAARWLAEVRALVRARLAGGEA